MKQHSEQKEQHIAVNHKEIVTSKHTDHSISRKKNWKFQTSSRQVTCIAMCHLSLYSKSNVCCMPYTVLNALLKTSQLTNSWAIISKILMLLLETRHKREWHTLLPGVAVDAEKLKPVSPACFFLAGTRKPCGPQNSAPETLARINGVTG